jgi:hypothetical protein
MYIFDIDGTLSDPTHRMHYILNPKPDWDSFFNACEYDEPIYSVINIARALYANNETILLLTGRSDICRTATENWLIEHDISWHGLMMRKHGDHRPDYSVKVELLFTFLEKPGMDQPIDTIFEDRKQVVMAWRELGYHVCQVAEGDF